MEALKNREIYEGLIEEAQNCKKKVLFLTAFCKLDALKDVDTYFSNKVVDKKLVVRFRYADIKAGVSDLNIYEYCKEHNWELYFQLDLHVKTYIFDDIRCISGSANLTRAGMGISEKPNQEYCSIYEVEDTDLTKIYSFLNEAVMIDDDIYDMMKKDVALGKVGFTDVQGDWNNKIKKLFSRKVRKVFMEELPHSGCGRNVHQNDYAFLKYYGEISDANIKDVFQESRAFRWLWGRLEESENKELYFGALSACLHEDIIAEPKPYRKEVKELLKNLIEWSEVFASDRLIIDVPNHSTRVRLISKER